jgi:hypothetical protein
MRLLAYEHRRISSLAALARSQASQEASIVRANAVDAKLRTLEALESLLAAGRVILIGQDSLGDYSASASGGKNRHSVSTTLLGALDGLTDVPATKICLRCTVAKRIGGYGPDKDSADGIASICKACESKRIGAIGQKKKRR